MTVALDAFNVLNRVNYVNYVGTLSSPLFGQPVTARAPRQLQLSVQLLGYKLILRTARIKF